MSRYYAHTAEVDVGLYGWLNRLLLWLIALAVVGLVILKYVPLIQKNVEIRRDTGYLTEQVARKQDELQQKRSEINRLKRDPRAMERYVRERLGQSRPDEWIITYTAN